MAIVPNQFKIIGYVVTLVSIVCLYLVYYEGVNLAILNTSEKSSGPSQNLSDEVALTLLLLSLLSIIFSKEKKEDEFFNQIRLQSFFKAIGLYAIIQIIAIWVLYDESFLDYALINLFLPLVFYILFYEIQKHLIKREE
ncbi:MAG: hypothetical protein ACXITV_08170 [Luteibaculaceae bacterium]